MHTCMTAIGLTAKIQIHRLSGFVHQSLCDCSCAGDFLSIEMRQYSLIHNVNYLYVSLSYLMWCRDIWLVKPESGSLTHAMCNPTEKNHPHHFNVEVCCNAMSELKKTRDMKRLSEMVEIFSIIKLGGLRSQRQSEGFLTCNLLWQC